MNTPILAQLLRYADAGVYPFHMPGHKRKFPDFEKNIYEMDVTEIYGMDELHDPEGIIRESMDVLREVYGTKESFYLVNGSTGGILAAIFSAINRKEEILVARNCHKSVYHAIELCGANPVFLYPKWIKDFDFYGELSPKKVEEVLSKRPKIKALVLTSPTYEGVVSDIGKITEICRKHGVLCIVDEAHGAHLPFASKVGDFPQSAISLGADLVIQSLHKTLPSLTQTAVLHVPKGSRIKMERLKHYLSVFQTSSPSYLFMASMERCVGFLREEGEARFVSYEKQLNEFYASCKGGNGSGLKFFRLFEGEESFGFDKGKLVISVKNTPFSGADLADCLRTKYGIEIEMQAATYVIAMTSLMDEEEGFLRLKTALFEMEEQFLKDSFIDVVARGGNAAKAGNEKVLGESRKEEKVHFLDSGTFEGESEDFKIPKATREYSVKKTRKLPFEEVSLLECEGRVSKEYVFVYPPGIPVLVPGEKITEKIRDLLLKYMDLGLNVKGVCDDKKIKVLSSPDGKY